MSLKLVQSRFRERSRHGRLPNVQTSRTYKLVAASKSHCITLLGYESFLRKTHLRSDHIRPRVAMISMKTLQAPNLQHHFLAFFVSAVPPTSSLFLFSATLALFRVPTFCGFPLAVLFLSLPTVFVSLPVWVGFAFFAMFAFGLSFSLSLFVRADLPGDLLGVPLAFSSLSFFSSDFLFVLDFGCGVPFFGSFFEPGLFS